jgi:hypothetical protein
MVDSVVPRGRRSATPKRAAPARKPPPPKKPALATAGFLVLAAIKYRDTGGPIDGASYQVAKKGEKKPLASGKTDRNAIVRHAVKAPGKYVVSVLRVPGRPAGKKPLGEGAVDARPAAKAANPVSVLISVPNRRKKQDEDDGLKHLQLKWKPPA